MSRSEAPPTGVRGAADRAGISSRPGAAHPDPAAPPGEQVPPPEGAASRVTPTPTRGRVIIPLPDADSVVSENLPRRHRWRVEDINGAPDAETAVRRMFEWARAELAKCGKNRPEEADAFRWQLIHRMAPLVAAVHKSHPAPAFLACPRLPGGGWVPRKPRTRAAEGRPPRREGR